MKTISSHDVQSSPPKRLKTAPSSITASRYVEDGVVTTPHESFLKDHANVLHGSILSRILTFAHAHNIPSIALTCSSWKAALEDVDEEIIRHNVLCRYPRLHELKLLEEKCLAGGSGTGVFAISTYKDLLKRRLSMGYKPSGANRDLQADFHTMFAHRGILAFSNCCRTCTNSYDELDETFQFREDGGVDFIHAYLNGMNYENTFGDFTGVRHGSIEYISEHWEEECKLLDLWCHIIGLDSDDYTLEKPGFMGVIGSGSIVIHVNPGLRVALEYVERDLHEWLCQIVAGGVKLKTKF